MVVTDLDELWTFIPEQNDFLFHLNWDRWSLEYLFQLFYFLKRKGMLPSQGVDLAYQQKGISGVGYF